MFPPVEVVQPPPPLHYRKQAGFSMPPDPPKLSGAVLMWCGVCGVNLIVGFVLGAWLL